MSSRVEELLAAAVDGSGTDGLDPPQSRNEKLLFALNDKLDNVESALAGKVDGPADGQAYQQLVTDADGNTKWEDRLAYDDTYAISWDGNTDGLVSVELAPGYAYYKVSDFAIDRDNLLSFNYTTANGVYNKGGVNHTTSLGAAWADDGSGFFVVTEPTTVSGMTFPESGLYLSRSVNYVNKITLSYVKRIDRKYITSALIVKDPRQWTLDEAKYYRNEFATGTVLITEYDAGTSMSPRKISCVILSLGPNNDNLTVANIIVDGAIKTLMPGHDEPV